MDKTKLYLHLLVFAGGTQRVGRKVGRRLYMPILVNDPFPTPGTTFKIDGEGSQEYIVLASERLFDSWMLHIDEVPQIAFFREM